MPDDPLPPKPPVPPSSSPAGSHGRGTFVTALIISGSALAVLIILCLFVLLLVRRRRRRRREALLELEAALAPAAPTAATPEQDVQVEAEEEGEEAVHHAWHIRTVGLDQAAIESIALTRYRAGGALGASDCAVCLGEFADGELLRLLPGCAHAFHVACIDTWLRAHVNCPLCRSHVLETPPSVAAEPSGWPAEAAQSAASRATEEHEPPVGQAGEQPELRLQIDQHAGLSTSPEQQPRHHTGSRGANFRRVLSMGSPSPMASTPEADDDDQAGAGGEKQGTGGCSGNPKNHRGMKRSLSVGGRWALVSHRCRRPVSLLPL